MVGHPESALPFCLHFSSLHSKNRNLNPSVYFQVGYSQLQENQAVCLGFRIASSLFTSCFSLVDVSSTKLTLFNGYSCSAAMQAAIERNAQTGLF